jgi:Family of unknown function (DUF5681)
MSNRKANVTSFQPGVSGNPNGRPVGSRNAFSAAFVHDLTVSWAKHGASILDQVAKRDPSRFLGVCASVIPKDVAVSITDRNPGNLSNEDWAIMMEVMTAIRQALPDAGQREPREILQHTLTALRAYSAKTIEGE